MLRRPVPAATYNLRMSAAVASAPPPAAPPPSGPALAQIRRRTTRLLFASQIFGSASTAAALAVATILAADILGASTWAGLPNAVRILGAALFSVPLSTLMLRCGRRRGLALCYAVGAVGAAASVLAALLLDYALLLVGSALFGAGYAANLLSRYAAADVSPASERGRAISLVVWGATIGAVAGPSLIGPAGEQLAHFGLPAIAGAFVISTATFGMAALLIGAGLRPDPLAIARLVAAADPALQGTAPARPLGELLRLPEVLVALITLMCSNLVMIAVMAMTPVYMHEHGHGLPAVGLVISAHVVGMYLGSPATGWLADRIGRSPVIALSALTFIAAAVLNALTPDGNGALLALGMWLIGLGWNLGFVAGSALLTDAVDLPERPRLQGLADTGMGVVAALGSLASGPILAGAGFATLNLAVALAVVFPLAAIGIDRLHRLRATAAS